MLAVFVIVVMVVFAIALREHKDGSPKHPWARTAVSPVMLLAPLGEMPNDRSDREQAERRHQELLAALQPQPLTDWEREKIDRIRQRELEDTQEIPVTP